MYDFLSSAGCAILVRHRQTSSDDQVTRFISDNFVQMPILFEHTASLLQRGQCLPRLNRTKLLNGLVVCGTQHKKIELFFVLKPENAMSRNKNC